MLWHQRDTLCLQYYPWAWGYDDDRLVRPSPPFLSSHAAPRRHRIVGALPYPRGRKLGHRRRRQCVARASQHHHRHRRDRRRLRRFGRGDLQSLTLCRVSRDCSAVILNAMRRCDSMRCDKLQRRELAGQSPQISQRASEPAREQAPATYRWVCCLVHKVRT